MRFKRKPTSRERARAEALANLERLMDVAGMTTPWKDLRRQLEKWPLRLLLALSYRVAGARCEAYEDGEAHGRG